MPIITVPDDPSISQLAMGEVISDDISDKPIGQYGICALAGLMAWFFIVGSVLQWKGWDIDFDSKTHQFSIKRFGTGQ